MGGEDMSKTYRNEDDLPEQQSDYIQNLTSRDMRSIPEPSEDTKAQTQEDAEEGWEERPQSPLAGRMSGTMEDLERMQISEMMASDEVQQCLRDCIDSYRFCTETVHRCLSMGGNHAEADHINLLLDCARICNTNADFMLRNSTYYPQTCGITADICDECADNCDRFDDDFMKECASVCRRCAESCREMAR
jgi:hypothetical protein